MLNGQITEKEEENLPLHHCDLALCIHLSINQSINQSIIIIIIILSLIPTGTIYTRLSILLYAIQNSCALCGWYFEIFCLVFLSFSWISVLLTLQMTQLTDTLRHWHKQILESSSQVPYKSSYLARSLQIIHIFEWMAQSLLFSNNIMLEKKQVHTWFRRGRFFCYWQQTSFSAIPSVILSVKNCFLF